MRKSLGVGLLTGRTISLFQDCCIIHETDHLGREYFRIDDLLYNIFITYNNILARYDLSVTQDIMDFGVPILRFGPLALI